MNISTNVRLEAGTVKVARGADHGEGVHSLVIEDEIFAWGEDEVTGYGREVTGYGRTMVNLTGTPAQLFALARQIDKVAAELASDTVEVIVGGEPTGIVGRRKTDGIIEFDQ